MEIWVKVGRGILRSSAFLATYCALAWGGACTGFAARGQLDPVGLSISCWTGKDPQRYFPMDRSSLFLQSQHGNSVAQHWKFNCLFKT